MNWQEKLTNAIFIYVDVSLKEIEAIKIDHYYTQIDGINAIGTREEIVELSDKLWEYIPEEEEIVPEEPVIVPEEVPTVVL
jgi:hypothetical protein